MRGWGRNRPDLLGIPPNRQLCLLLTPALDTQNVIDESDFPSQSLRALASIKVRWMAPALKERARPETEASNWAMAFPQDQDSHIFNTPFSATKILAWLSALKKQQRWCKGWEANHVPSEVNKFLSKLNSKDRLKPLPKMHMWNLDHSFLSPTQYHMMTFWTINAFATN